MKSHILIFLVCFISIANAIADNYTTVIHHKDGRVFAIATNQIDSITHIDGEPAEFFYNLTDSFVYPPHMNALMGVMVQAAANVPNSVLCSEENKEALFSQNACYMRNGEPWTHTALFSLIDDDALDEFIPSSNSGNSISENQKVGGYFSLLYPFLRSLEVKYNIPLTCGIAAEGQRIGLTPYWSTSDVCSLNENGQLLQQLLQHAQWECLCHSMTARISPDGSIYIVDSLNSADAQYVLANGKWGGAYSFNTAGVYDRKTKKNYTITSNRTSWTETPQKYIQPYCYNRQTDKWIYNESFPIDYQVGEWKRRATQLGFSYPDIMVHWGNTTAAPLINKSRTYFSHSIDPSGLGNGVNIVPLSATIHRISAITSSNKNAYNATYYKKLKNSVDNAIATHGWLVFMSHFNTIYYYNGYLDDVTYPDKDLNYNPEWTNPLVTEEIRSMDENNYWDNPPARLGIENWGEWRPAKGTQLYGLYTIFEYAIEKGLQNVSPSEGIKIMGNKVNIGTYRDKDYYPREKAMQLTPIDNCYYVVGSDGSIKYHSEK